MKRKATWNLTRLLVLLALVVLMTSVMGVVAFAAEPQTPAEKECYINGDVNADGIFDDQDAIYALYSYMFGEEEYPIRQQWNYTGSASGNVRDVIYMLDALGNRYESAYANMGVEKHDYVGSAWTWTEDGDNVSATLTLTCACGQQKVLGEGEGVGVGRTQRTEPLCLTTGSEVYSASVTFQGETYTGSYTRTLAALGHQAGAELYPDAQGHHNVCINPNCGVEMNAANHNWYIEQQADEANFACGQMVVQQYVCACGATKTENLHIKEHDYQAIPGVADVLVDANTCQYAKEQLQCSKCNGTIYAGVYTKHVYAASVVDATCQAPGVKTYSCTECNNHSYTEDIPVDSTKHTWDNGVEGSGIITYTCGGCGATKTAVSASGNSATVSKDTLKSADELKMDNATLELDQSVKENLDQNKKIQISVDSKDLAEVESTLTQELTQEQKDKIGDGQIYDFNMLYAGTNEKVDFQGWITVTLPYELQPGDDVDSIWVWYIADDGTLDHYEATYSNGYVTFKTNHFSYYTVTRLTPAQRCEVYGHIWKTFSEEATCTQPGYTKEVCQRCAAEKGEDTIIPATGHSYGDPVVTPATCLNNGYEVQTCGNCSSTKTTVITAMGHNMVLSKEASVGATCTAAGKEVYVCDRENCSHSIEKPLAQLTHSYQYTSTTAATCTTGGYDLYTCELCNNDTVKKNETAPLGHNFSADNAQWNWSDDYSSVTVVLTCGNNCGSTKEVKAAVTIKGASCTAAGSAKAEILYNNKVYTDQRVTGEAQGHKPGANWVTGANRHHLLCQVCGEKLENDVHGYGEGVVTKEPTCVAAGTTTYTCTTCGYEKNETISATGVHNMVDDVCVDCGFEVVACTHQQTYPTKMDLSGYAICEGNEICWYSCTCGEVKYLEFDKMGCEFKEGESRVETTEDGYEYKVQEMICATCGMKLEAAEYAIYSTEPCSARYTMWGKISLGDVVIAEFTYSPEDAVDYHPTSKVVKNVDLSEYGVCGEQLTTYECPCGEHSYTRRSTKCEFIYTEDGESSCQNCGVVREMQTQFQEVEGTCQTLEINTFFYYVGGVEVYSYSNTYTYDQHDYEITEYQLSGSSCINGIRVVQTCKVCGEVSKYESYDHEMILETVVDLSGFKTCYDQVILHSCPCEEAVNYAQFISNDGQGCMWYPHSYNDETKTETVFCKNCESSQTVVSTYGDKDENCMVEVLDTHTYFDADGKLMVVTTQRGHTSDHDMTVTRELLGTSCKDGVNVSEICADCGQTYQYEEYYHSAELIQEQDMAELGLCGGVAEIYSCLCGEEYWVNWNDQCQWEWLESTEDGYVRRCVNCSTVHTYAVTLAEQISACQRSVIVTDVYTRGIKEVFRTTRDGMQWNHDYVTEITLAEGAKSCIDGVVIKESCNNCDLSNEWTESGRHMTSKTGEELLTDKLCGTVLRVTYSCPCGEESRTNLQWVGDQCAWEWVFSEEHNRWLDRCSVCGAVQYQTYTEKPIEGETCKVEVQWLYTYELNGEVLFTNTSTGTGIRHNMEAIFNMQGKTCADGYTVSYVCSGCGTREDQPDVYYECNTFVKEKTLIVSADKGICGDIYLYYNSCPCGARTEYHTSVNCRLEHLGYDEQTQTINAQCADCGLLRMISDTTEPIPDTCLVNNITTHVYMLGDTQVGTASFSRQNENHKYETGFSLVGQTCEDGYYLTYVCKDCGYQKTEDTLYTEHSIWRLEWYELKDYGLCGGEVEKYGCACGEKAHWQHFIDCNRTHTGNKDPETGMDEWYCEACNTSIYVETTSTHDQLNCRENGVFTLKLVRNGETLLNVADSYSREMHTEIATGFALDVEGSDCESGYTVYLKCQHCDYTATSGGMGHGCYTTERINFDTVCGGYIRKYRCACGEYDDMDRYVYCQDWKHSASEETDEQGRLHRIEDRTCTTCGMIQREEWYDVYPEDSCAGIRYITNSIWLDGKLLAQSSRETEANEHVYGDSTYQLMEGAKSCYDGVLEIQKCKYCGESTTNHLYYHKRFELESIELDTVCGAKLVLSKCICGEKHGYEFSEDSLCDFDEAPTEHWIENIINNNQYGTEGWTDTWSYSYIYTCAVTEPQCGYAIRMSRYWLVANCVATEYETWQLGYDAKTGTCVEEITIATGRTASYHNYECNSSAEEREEGGWIHTSVYSCPDCGSTMTEVSTNDANGNSLYWERHCYNKLNNGENLENHLYNDYTFIYNGHNLIKEYGGSTIAADGTEYWYKYVNTYNFPESCKYVQTYTDSKGASGTNEYEHYNVYESEVVKQPTCSQPGQRVEKEMCLSCKQVTNEYYYEIEPTCHSWQWNNELQIDVCGVCGLKNINGASGNITLEDMTAAYGQDTNYVIGYYIREQGDFMVYASVILEEVTEGNDELILEGIEFVTWTAEQNTINAIVTNKAAVAEAAAAAMESAGYTGSYAIRITFVPADGDGELDYAITFDSQTE